MSPGLVGLGYFWGDDGYGLDRAAARLAKRIGEAAGEPLETWRVRGDQTSAPEIAERVGTQPMFGGGTLVLVTEPVPLARTIDLREVLLPVLRNVAPGNALVFLEPVDGSGRGAASMTPIREAVAAAGGEVRELKAPRGNGMQGWIEREAGDRGLRLSAGASAELARRIGAFVNEGDIDRRRQGHVAVGELDKLRLLRGTEPVTVDDVRALVSEAVPGSMWAFLDAVAERKVAEALTLLERLLPVTPEPVLLAVLHRRVRELIIVADLIAATEPPPAIMRALGAKSAYPVEKLVKAQHHWTMPELERALDALLELDATLKGHDRALEPGQRWLAITLWVVEHARPQRA